MGKLHWNQVNEMINNFIEMLNLFGSSFYIGILIAVVCSVFGVFVVIKRVVFIGITLSEVSALGIAVALVLKINTTLGAVLMTLICVSLLSYPFERIRIPRDAVLGAMFVLASGLSIILVSESGFGLEKVTSILNGNLLYSSTGDFISACCVLIPALLYLIVFFRPTVYSFIDPEFSKIMNIRTGFWDFLFFIVLGLVISISSKIVGLVLVFSFIVVSPTIALLFSRNLIPVIIISALIGVISTVTGMFFSYTIDLPTSQTVCVLNVGIMIIVVFKKILFKAN